MCLLSNSSFIFLLELQKTITFNAQRSFAMSTLVYMERLIDNMEDKLTDMQNQNHKLSEEIDQLWEFIFEYALSYAQSHIDHVQFKKRFSYFV